MIAERKTVCTVHLFQLCPMLMWKLKIAWRLFRETCCVYTPHLTFCCCNFFVNFASKGSLTIGSKSSKRCRLEFITIQLCAPDFVRIYWLISKSYIVTDIDSTGCFGRKKIFPAWVEESEKYADCLCWWYYFSASALCWTRIFHCEIWACVILPCPL